MSRRILLIDALRGVAASVVFWHHVTVFFPTVIAGPSLLSTAGSWVSDRNVEAVLLFFVLSGLSIGLSIKALDMRTKAGVNEYLYRRFRRILPLYWLSLVLAGAIALALAPAPPSAMSPITLLGNLAFLQTSANAKGTWFEPFAGNGPLWSLSYEMFYYLAFPLVLLLAKPRARALAVLGATTIGLVVQQVMPNPIATFLASSLVWYLGVELAQLGLNGRASFPLWCFSGLAVALALVLKVRASATLQGLLVGLLFFHAGYALIAAARRGTSMPHALNKLVIEPLAWIGSFSFGLYLLHYPLLRAAAQLAPGWLGLALAVFIGIAVAYFAEQRAIRATLPWLRRRYV
jgi:peptidoglycan/LPS O-acetylase OafA/YrhL